jgi:tetratricopeptide (TPR) repeat protein
MAPGFYSSLHRPLHVAAPGEEAFNAEVARGLAWAYFYLTRAPAETESFLRAFSWVVRVRDARMSKRQRMLIAFVSGMAFAADGDLPEAHDSISEAMEIASELQDNGALAELFYLRGGIYRANWQIADANEDYRTSLALVRELSARGAPRDADFELDMLSYRAGFEWLMSHYDVSAQLLQEGQRLFPNSSLEQREAPWNLASAVIEWYWALLYWTQGDCTRALHYAMRAADAYRLSGAPLMASRMDCVVGEIACDLADTFPVGTLSHARTLHIEMAISYVRTALQLSRSVGDQAGEGRARLTRARLDRMRQRNVDTAPIINAVIGTARRLGDMSLLVLAYTALGRDLAGRGENESSLNWYRAALSALEGHDFVVLGFPARRALLHASEMGDD